MSLLKFSKGSRHPLQKWEYADVLLQEAQFNDADREIVLRAASKNNLNPVFFARRAIRLRQHVEGGNK